MVKCIQNFIKKNESNELIEQMKEGKNKILGKKKHLDYTPVLFILFRFIRWFIKIRRHIRNSKNIRSIS